MQVRSRLATSALSNASLHSQGSRSRCQRSSNACSAASSSVTPLSPLTSDLTPRSATAQRARPQSAAHLRSIRRSRKKSNSALGTSRRAPTVAATSSFQASAGMKQGPGDLAMLKAHWCVPSHQRAVVSGRERNDPPPNATDTVLRQNINPMVEES